MRFGLYAIGMAALALLAFTASTRQPSSATSAGTVLIGAGNVLLGDEEVTAGGLTVRAFVPTDSLSPNCLTTFSESNFAVPGLTLFCGSRNANPSVSMATRADAGLGYVGRSRCPSKLGEQSRAGSWILVYQLDSEPWHRDPNHASVPLGGRQNAGSRQPRGHPQFPTCCE